ncbi:MAG TPA: hypothetical protein VFG83_07945 [Kofleriaceae bacterium]|nr:hypothetical protein [Kofleriaceae bacterium]
MTMLHLVRTSPAGHSPMTAVADGDIVVYVESHDHHVVWHRRDTGERLTARQIVDIAADHRVIVW